MLWTLQDKEVEIRRLKEMVAEKWGKRMAAYEGENDQGCDETHGLQS